MWTTHVHVCACVHVRMYPHDTHTSTGVRALYLPAHTDVRKQVQKNVKNHGKRAARGARLVDLRLGNIDLQLVDNEKTKTYPHPHVQAFGWQTCLQHFF